MTLTPEVGYNLPSIICYCKKSINRNSVYVKRKKMSCVRSVYDKIPFIILFLIVMHLQLRSFPHLLLHLGI